MEQAGVTPAAERTRRNSLYATAAIALAVVVVSIVFAANAPGTSSSRCSTSAPP
jgi:hypothetical protein